MSEKIEKNVCSSGWSGNSGSTLTLKNDSKNDVTVSSDSSCPWPFKKPTGSFTIKTKGTQDVTLVDTAGTNYCYRTTGCLDDHRTNPKTVIIT